MISIDSFLSPHFLCNNIGETSQSASGSLRESVQSGGKHSNVILEKRIFKLQLFGALQQIFLKRKMEKQ